MQFATLWDTIKHIIDPIESQCEQLKIIQQAKKQLSLAKHHLAVSKILKELI